MRWLDRRICAPGPYLTLCLTDKDFKKAMKHCRISDPPKWLKGDSHATSHFCRNGENQLVAIVTMRKWEGRDPIEVAGLLTHEAVHVWQEYADVIGEHTPGSEQEAYGIQTVAQELMAEFRRLTKGKS